MKKVKRLVTAFLVIVTIMSVMAAPANAANLSASSSMSMKGSSSKTGFSCTSTWKLGGFTGIKFNGTSYTYWYGYSPYNADSITHKNVIILTNLGGIGISNSGGSCSISGSTITDSFSVKNTWKVNTTYRYDVSAYIFSFKFKTSARVQFGSSFYTWCTD